MEMLERCPGCSVTRELDPKKADSLGARPCSRCGYDGPFPPPEREVVSGRDSLPSFAGARAKLATATQDLFRLSGNHSIPVEAKAVSEQPPATSAPAPESPVSSARKPEASMMFSLEALMKANQTPLPPRDEALDETSQLWSMQAATPLFGTSQDQALLTTPLKMEPAQSMDSMTLPSEAPSGRRWWPIVLAAGAGLVLAGAGIYVFGSKGPANAASPSSEQAALVAQPAPPAVLPPPAAGSDNRPLEGAVAAAPEGTQAAEKALETGGASGAEAASAEAAPGASTPGQAPAAPASEGSPAEKTENAVASTKAKPGTPKPAPPRPIVPAPSKPAASPFDKGAAKTALNTAAAEAASCGAGGEPGKGKVQVTFAPSGKVSDAELVEGPFAGTTAGKCALRHFRAAKVPAFSGAPITVAKSFRVD